MPQHLVWLFKRAGIACDPTDGNGNDLGGNDGGSTELTDEEKAAKAEAEAAAAAAAEKAKKGETDNDDQDDGKKTTPSDAEAKLLKEVMANKAKAKEAADALKAINDALGGASVDDIKTLLAERKEAERKALEARGEYDRILEQVKTEHERVTQDLNAQIQALQEQLGEKDTVLVDLTVGRAFSESAFVREKSVIPVSLARKEFGANVDIVDGVAVVYDKPRGAADRTPLVDGQGKYKSFEEGIAALYAAHPDSASLIRASGKPGAGSSNQDTGKKPNPAPTEIAPGKDRIAAGLAKMNQ